MEIFKLFGSIFIDTSEADESMDKTESKASKLAEGLGKGIQTAAKWGAGLAMAAGTAATAIGGMAVNSADSMNQAMNSFAASTGVAEGNLEMYKDVLEEVYNNNYGESFEDIAAAMASMEQQGLTSMIDDMDELEKALEYGYLLQDTFGIDMEESTRGAVAMMNQFGITAEEAYNLIAQGAENGLNQNGDLADQMAEYSVYWADLGFTAEQAMNALQSGASNGAFQIDYLNDAIKEFGIRAKDNSDGTKTAFEELGLDAEELTAKFAEGGQASSSAFSEVVSALNDCDDKVKQNELGVALFGTKWEDLGIDAVKALTSMTGNISTATDALSGMAEVKYDDLGSRLETIKRNLETSVLVPLGESLVPLIEQVLDAVMEGMPMIQGLFEQMTPFIADLFSQALPPLLELAEQILPVIVELISAFLPVFMEMAQTLLPVFTELITMLVPPLMEIVQAVLPVVSTLLQALTPIIGALLEFLKPIFEIAVAIIVPIAQLISDALQPLLMLLSQLITEALGPMTEKMELVAAVVEGAMAAAFESLLPIIDSIRQVFSGLIDFITGVFTGDWETAWNGVVDIFSGIFSGLVNIIKAPLNTIIGGINSLFSSLGSIEIPDWVPFIGGSSFTLPQIPMLAKGGVVEESGAVLVGEEAPEILDLPKGARVTPLSGRSRVDDFNYDILRDIIIEAIRMVVPELEQVIQVVPDEEGIYKIVRKKAKERSASTGEYAWI